MKKMPPQSAMHERLVGSALGERPRGPTTRPRKLHTTTRRMTQQMATHTLHLRKIQPMIRHFFLFLPPHMFLNLLRFYLMNSEFSTMGTNVLILLCTWVIVWDRLFNTGNCKSWETCAICLFMSPSSCLLSKNKVMYTGY